MRYRRAWIAGGSFFFTVVTAGRRPVLASTEAVEVLRLAFRKVRLRYPFEVDAMVVMPDHIHCIWTLPPGDADFATRWRLIKTWFTKHCDPALRGIVSGYSEVSDYAALIRPTGATEANEASDYAALIRPTGAAEANEVSDYAALIRPTGATKANEASDYAALIRPTGVMGATEAAAISAPATAIWQHRYWEHALRDEEDYARHVDYIHFNPVKHGLVSAAKEWPYSSFQRFVEAGIYPLDWGQSVMDFEGVGHE